MDPVEPSKVMDFQQADNNTAGADHISRRVLDLAAFRVV